MPLRLSSAPCDIPKLNIKNKQIIEGSLFLKNSNADKKIEKLKKIKEW